MNEKERIEQTCRYALETALKKEPIRPEYQQFGMYPIALAYATIPWKRSSLPWNPR